MGDVVDVDIIWKKLGSWGKFQRKQLAVYLFSCFSWALHNLTIVFIGFRPAYHCTETPFPNTTDNGDPQWREYGKCAITTYVNTTEGLQTSKTDCVAGYTYDARLDSSIVTTWDLVCSRGELAELSQALVTVGQICGAFFFTGLSDRFGRRPIMTFSHAALFVLAMGSAFTPDFTAFLVLRFFTGMMQQGVGLVGSTFALETFPKEIRAYTETLALVWWTTAIVLMVPIAYFMRDISWRYIQMTFSLFSVWALVEWWMLDESLRWLLVNGKIKEAKAVMMKACRMNGKNFDEISAASGFDQLDVNLETVTPKENVSTKDKTEDASKQLLPQGNQTDGGDDVATDVANGKNDVDKGMPSVPTAGADDKLELTQDRYVVEEIKISNSGQIHPQVLEVKAEKMKVKKYTAWDILKRRHLLVISLILWAVWLTDSLVYFGLYLISDSLAGDRYINFLLNGIIEYPSALGEYLFINRIGRKKTAILAHAVAAVGLVVSTILIVTAGSSKALMSTSTAFAVFGKMGATAAFSSAFIYTPELYPTNMRNAGFGMAAMAGKIGSVFSPFFRNLAEVALWAPGAIFAAMCFAVMLLLLLIPETSGVELPQTMDELKQWHKLNAIVKTGRKLKKYDLEKSDKAQLETNGTG